MMSLLLGMEGLAGDQLALLPFGCIMVQKVLKESLLNYKLDMSSALNRNESEVLVVDEVLNGTQFYRIIQKH